MTVVLSPQLDHTQNGRNQGARDRRTVLNQERKSYLNDEVLEGDDQIGRRRNGVILPVNQRASPKQRDNHLRSRGRGQQTNCHVLTGLRVLRANRHKIRLDHYAHATGVLDLLLSG